MEQAGWVTSRDKTPGWTLGPKLLTLTGVRDNVLNEIAQEEIEALTDELGFVVFIVEKEKGGGYRVIAVAEQTSGVRVTASIGDGFPFSAPAIMQAFFAWTDPSEVAKLVKTHKLLAFTDKSITSLDELNTVLAHVRQNGYSQSIQQFDIGQGGVAAPVFDTSGQVRQVICSLAFYSQLNHSNVESVGKAVRRCAEAITRRSGGIPPQNYRDQPSSIGTPLEKAN